MKKNGLYTGLVILALVVFAGCASTGGGAGQTAEEGSEAPTAAAVSSAEQNESFSLERTEGPAKLELDLSAFREADFDFSWGNISIHVVRAENGEGVFRQAQHFNEENSSDSMKTEWSSAEWPEDELEIYIHLRAASHEEGFFEMARTYGPISYDRGSPSEEQLTIKPEPYGKTGSLSLEAKNETGIGDLNHGLGVFLQSLSSDTSYHYHLPPGKKYLSYSKTIEGIEAGKYRFTVMAEKDGWPYYGNAVWEGELEVREGETTSLSGSLSEKTAPWNMGISEEDLQLEGVSPVYETEFDDRDPRMGSIDVAEGGSAGLKEGSLVVEGVGNLSGGLNISVPTGSNTLIRLRAKVPEDGEFFFNTRVWGDSRMAVIVNPEREDRPARFHSFSTAEGRDLPAARIDQTLPELEAGQWHDFVFVDNGKRLYIFVDGTLYAAFPIPEELPEKGNLGLEWHQPCSFDRLSVSSFESMKPPEGL